MQIWPWPKKRFNNRSLSRHATAALKYGYRPLLIELSIQVIDFIQLNFFSTIFYRPSVVDIAPHVR